MTASGAAEPGVVVGDLVVSPARVAGRVPFPGISCRAWEHPADKAAMAALRKVPGFDTLIRKFVGFVGERSIRALYLANAVRVSERQLSRVHAVYRDCLAVLDFQTEPELFVVQTPIVNAGAVGMDRPFIVLNSASLDLLTEDELRCVIGHELGHIASDHALYKTMLGVLLNASIGRLGIPLAPIAVFAIVAALREWSRKAEHSADRAGLLCVQDPRTAYTVEMKLAGGPHADQMSVDEFVRQADDYLAGGDALDSVAKLMNLLSRTHPFPVLRLAELKRWVDSGAYDAILAGDYPRRDQDARASIYDELADGARSYKEAYATSKDPLMAFAQDLGELGGKLVDRARGLFGGRGPGK